MDSENTLRARIKVLEYVEFKAAASAASCSVQLFVDFLATMMSNKHICCSGARKVFASGS